MADHPRQPVLRGHRARHHGEPDVLRLRDYAAGHEPGHPRQARGDRPRAEFRRQRSTTRHPGQSISTYLLRNIARCDRCDGRMHGQKSGKKGLPRYYCTTRKKAKDACGQPLAPASEI
ncbi:zinc ribbon domain-containing protein, partial [Baekduia sp.]|uniref:zinc ribbon domain-containing protein n=1 Tax=Baekduia sp. TaxID=2600305 RepID=UPI0039C872D7